MRRMNLLPILLGWTMIAIGLAAMATVMWMTGRFAWGLQEATADRWASASLHLLNDAAGAILIGAGSFMLSRAEWRTRLIGLFALSCALVLVTYSIVSVYGFMSTRIVQLEGHKNVVAWQKGELDWKRKTSVSREVAKSDRVLLRAESRLAAKELKRSLQFIPDAQAAGIAAWFDMSVDRVQRALVIITSCIGQLIKVTCVFFGVSFLSYRAQDAAPGQMGQASHLARGQMIQAGQVDQVRQVTDLQSRQADSPSSNVRGEWRCVDPCRDESTEGKWARQQVLSLLAQVAHLEPRRSTRSIAHLTGWPRRTLDRMRCRLTTVDPAVGVRPTRHG